MRLVLYMNLIFVALGIAFAAVHGLQASPRGSIFIFSIALGIALFISAMDVAFIFARRRFFSTMPVLSYAMTKVFFALVFLIVAYTLSKPIFSHLGGLCRATINVGWYCY